jgi:hypothetical protein
MEVHQFPRRRSGLGLPHRGRAGRWPLRAWQRGAAVHANDKGARPSTQPRYRAYFGAPSPHTARQRRPRMGGGGPARSGAPLPRFPPTDNPVPAPSAPTAPEGRLVKDNPSFFEWGPPPGWGGEIVFGGHFIFHQLILPTRPLRGPPAPRGRGGKEPIKRPPRKSPRWSSMAD